MGGGKVGKGRMGFKEMGDSDWMLPEVEGGEVGREGRAVEEMDGGIFGQVAVWAGWGRGFDGINSVLVGSEFGAVA